MYKRIKNSLNLKLNLLVVLVAIVVFTVIIIVSGYWQKAAMVHQLEEAAIKTAELVKLSIEKPMIVGNDEGTRHEFKFLAEHYPDMRVVMTNHAGNITYSTESSNERKDFAQCCASTDVADLASRALKTMLNDGLMTELDGRKVYAHVESIANAPSCHHCHGASKPILGQMTLVQDVTPVMAAIDGQLFKMLALFLAGLILISGTIIFFINRVVI
ncbi:MAG: methyl-accepting chemotaxis protein, partial [Deltaproteobacteria bacterium]|nr:methyl-accepting chemotaxis protein [Deltaproteobacteria bacterium]